MTNKLTLVYHIELTKKVLIVLVVLVPKLVSSNQRPCPQVTKSGEMRRDKRMGCWVGGTGVKWKTSMCSTYEFATLQRMYIHGHVILIAQLVCITGIQQHTLCNCPFVVWEWSYSLLVQVATASGTEWHCKVKLWFMFRPWQKRFVYSSLARTNPSMEHFQYSTQRNRQWSVRIRVLHTS